MPLTEEEKQKISEEEAYRASVKANQADTSNKPKKMSGCFKLFLMIVAIFVGFGFLMGILSPLLPKSENIKEIEDLKVDKELMGRVNFDGLKFTIYNEGNFNWTGCRPVLNDNYKISNDSSIVINISAKENYPIQSGEFILKDGSRFNPFSTKPQSISLGCKEGFGYWAWN